MGSVHLNNDHCYSVAGSTDIVDVTKEIVGRSPEKMETIRQHEITYLRYNNRLYVRGNYTDASNKKRIITLPVVVKRKNGDEPKFGIAPNEPLNTCSPDHANMLLLKDDKLVKKGDKFPSYNAFKQYLNEHGKRWFYYYRFYDRSRSNSATTFVYSCIYLRNQNRYTPRGLRKCTPRMITDCPCRIKIKRLVNEQEITVVSVCNHHDHRLCKEDFLKLQHGRRLPPYLKDEIRDLLILDVDMKILKKYVQKEINLDMSKAFFYKEKINTAKCKLTISEERTAELYEKIKGITIDVPSEQKIVAPRKPTPKKKDETPKAVKRKPSKNTTKKSKKSKTDEPSSPNCKETKRNLKYLQNIITCETEPKPTDSQMFPVPTSPLNNTVYEEPVEINLPETSAVNNGSIQRYIVGDIGYTVQYFNKDDGILHVPNGNTQDQRVCTIERRVLENHFTNNNFSKPETVGFSDDQSIIINSEDVENIECTTVYDNNHMCVIENDEFTDCNNEVKDNTDYVSNDEKYETYQFKVNINEGKKSITVYQNAGHVTVDSGSADSVTQENKKYILEAEGDLKVKFEEVNEDCKNGNNIPGEEESTHIVKYKAQSESRENKKAKRVAEYDIKVKFEDDNGHYENNEYLSRDCKNAITTPNDKEKIYAVEYKHSAVNITKYDENSDNVAENKENCDVTEYKGNSDYKTKNKNNYNGATEYKKNSDYNIEDNGNTNYVTDGNKNTECVTKDETSSCSIKDYGNAENFTDNNENIEYLTEDFENVTYITEDHKNFDCVVEFDENVEYTINVFDNSLQSDETNEVEFCGHSKVM